MHAKNGETADHTILRNLAMCSRAVQTKAPDYNRVRDALVAPNKDIRAMTWILNT